MQTLIRTLLLHTTHTEWAKMTRAEIVQLEMKILTALSYECAATQTDFDRYGPPPLSVFVMSCP